MLIPVTHENMRGRRWPYITIAIILLNVVVFLGTHWKLEDESQRLGHVKAHILLLAASNPDLEMTPAEKQLVESFRCSNGKLWQSLKSQQRQLVDSWDARMRLMEPDQAIEAKVSWTADPRRGRA